MHLESSNKTPGSHASTPEKSNLKDQSFVRNYPANVIKDMEAKLIEDYIPLCLVVGLENELVHIYGNTDKYPELSSDKGYNSIFELFSDDMSIRLEAAFNKVRRLGIGTVFKGLKLDFCGCSDIVNLFIKPFKVKDRNDHISMVFQKCDTSSIPIIEIENNGSNDYIQERTIELDNEFVNEINESSYSYLKYSRKLFLQSERQYRRLVEFLPIAVFIYDEDNIYYANRTALNLIGVSSRKHLKAFKITDFIDDAFKSLVIERMEAIMSTKSTAPLKEEKLIRTDGNVLDIEKTATYFDYKGITAILAVIKDVTAIRRAEAISRKAEKDEKLLRETLEYDQLKTEFFSNLSHELRTPLNVLLGALQLTDMYLKENMIIDSQLKLTKQMGILKQNCYRLLRLVNNLIDITRIDTGFYRVNLNNYNVVNIIEEITLSVAQYIEHKNLSLEFDTNVEELLIACDPDKIERIILNLLSNAVKFTPSGGKISVVLQKQDDILSVIISDSGIGIPDDKLNIIFERFRQVDKSLTRAHEGSGIGLSLVKSLVSMHGGSIDVKSELGKGSEFIIELPIKLLEQAQDAQMSITYEDDSINKKIERIKIEFSDIYSYN